MNGDVVLGVVVSEGDDTVVAVTEAEGTGT